MDNNPIVDPLDLNEFEMPDDHSDGATGQDKK